MLQLSRCVDQDGRHAHFKNHLLQNRGCIGVDSLHKLSGTVGISTDSNTQILLTPTSKRYTIYFDVGRKAGHFCI